MQEAWFRLDAALSKRIVHEPQAYLYKIVRNHALDRRSATSREGQIVTQEDIGEVAERSRFSVPTPEGVALYRGALRQLLQAMDELPERTRIAFQMHRLGG